MMNLNIKRYKIHNRCLFTDYVFSNYLNLINYFLFNNVMLNLKLYINYINKLYLLSSIKSMSVKAYFLNIEC